MMFGLAVFGPFALFATWIIVDEILKSRRHSRSRSEYDSRRETLDRIQRISNPYDHHWLMSHHWLSIGEEDNAARMMEEARRCAEAADPTKTSPTA